MGMELPYLRLFPVLPSFESLVILLARSSRRLDGRSSKSPMPNRIQKLIGPI